MQLPATSVSVTDQILSKLLVMGLPLLSNTVVHTHPRLNLEHKYTTCGKSSPCPEDTDQTTGSLVAGRFQIRERRQRERWGKTGGDLCKG